MVILNDGIYERIYLVLELVRFQSCNHNDDAVLYIAAARLMLQHSLETFTLAPHLISFNVQSSDFVSPAAAAAGELG